jgi:DNA-binding NarL/FixJ family response regulator
MSTHSDDTAPRSTRILIVDDHEGLRNAVATLLRDEPDLTVAAVVESAEDAILAARTHPVDLAIVDISLGRTNGLDLTRQLRREHPRLHVVILSMHDASLYSHRAAEAGASAYVAKQEAVETLIPAIRRVLAADTNPGDRKRPA